MKNIHIIMLAAVMASQTVVAENLEQSWDIALKHNPLIKARERQVESAQYGIEGAKSQRMPSVVATTGYTWLDNPQISTAGPMDMQVSEDNMLSYGMSMSVPIYTGGLISGSVKSAEAGLNIAQKDKQQLINTIKLRIAGSYINILRTQRLMMVAETRLDSLRSHHKNVEQLLKQEMVPKSDLLAVQASLADAKQSLLQSQNANEISIAQYNYLLGRALEYQVTLEDIDHADVEMSLGKFTELARENRVELAKAKNQKEALLANIDMVTAGVKPAVSFNTGYKYQDNSFTQYEGQWSATIGVQWKLFDGGYSGKKKSEIMLQIAALDEQIIDLNNMITLEVRSAWLTLNESTVRIETVKEAVSQSEESLRSIKAKYAAGMSTHSDVLDAEALRELSGSNFYNAKYDAALAKIKLQYAVGVL